MRYADSLTLCPQWDDIFVKRTLAFASASPSLAHSRLRRQCRPREPVLPALYPAARITAFEADPALVRDSRRQPEGESAAARSETRQVALWTSTGTLTFQCEGSDSGMISYAARRASTARATDGAEPAGCATSSTRDPVDLLKLDIEGRRGRRASPIASRRCIA